MDLTLEWFLVGMSVLVTLFWWWRILSFMTLVEQRIAKNRHALVH